VQGGRIVAVTRVDRAPAARRTVHLAEDEVLLPGLVDSHVHLQDPGRTDWEDVASASRAAALGGVTTLVDMPLDSDPVTVDVASVHAKQTALAGRSQVDYGLWGGAVPQSLGRLDGLVAAGVLGFKCFLSPTGIAGFDPLTPAQLRSALQELRPLGVPLLVHAEDETAALPLRGPTPRYDDYLASRPSRVEENAVAHVVAAVAATGGWAHLVHLSAAGSLPLVRAGRDGGGRLTAETAPHYLVLPGRRWGNDRQGDARRPARRRRRGPVERPSRRDCRPGGLRPLPVRTRRQERQGLRCRSTRGGFPPGGTAGAVDGGDAARS